MDIRKRWFVTLCVFILLAWTCSVYAEEDFAITGKAWMNDYTLILMDADSITEAYAAADAIELAGGAVYVIFPNQVMLGKVPAGAVNGLVGKNKITAIHKSPVLGPALGKITKSFKGNDQQMLKASADAISFFNMVAGKSWKSEKADAPKTRGAVLPDNFQAPRVNYSDVLTNLKANGLDEQKLAAAGISQKLSPEGDVVLNPGANDYMVGKVLFNAMFVESSGTIDSNRYT